MNNDNDIDYSTLLTPEIMATMPANLSAVDQFTWRQSKQNKLACEYKAKQKQNVSGNSQSAPVNAAQPPVQPPAEESKPAQSEESEQEITVPEVTIANSTDSVTDTVTESQNFKKAKNTVTKKPAVKTVSNNNTEFVKAVPASVMNAIRKEFPENLSKSDLVAAFVYLHTGGACDVSDAVKRVVAQHDGDKTQIEISERLAHIEQVLIKQNSTLQSIELCTNFNTFDRLYGSKEKRISPKTQEFREQGSLDMLSRLRQQADDQKKLDAIQTGRNIYNQTKDKGD